MDEGRDGGCLASCVGELDANLLALGVGEGGDLGPGGGLLVCPDPGVFRGDAAFGDDSAGFDDGEARAAREDATDYSGRG